MKQWRVSIIVSTLDTAEEHEVAEAIANGFNFGEYLPKWIKRTDVETCDEVEPDPAPVEKNAPTNWPDIE